MHCDLTYEHRLFVEMRIDQDGWFAHGTLRYSPENREAVDQATGCVPRDDFLRNARQSDEGVARVANEGCTDIGGSQVVVCGASGPHFGGQNGMKIGVMQECMSTRFQDPAYFAEISAECLEVGMHERIETENEIEAGIGRARKAATVVEVALHPRIFLESLTTGFHAVGRHVDEEQGGAVLAQVVAEPAIAGRDFKSIDVPDECADPGQQGAIPEVRRVAPACGPFLSAATPVVTGPELAILLACGHKSRVQDALRGRQEVWKTSPARPCERSIPNRRPGGSPCQNAMPGSE